ncbi:hypothetical protein GCM10023107_68320 [Actinoplanes octamycinicus]|nr:hypothetical protein Aoc01nite_25240 [Actinoplanes octamycinicus]
MGVAGEARQPGFPQRLPQVPDAALERRVQEQFDGVHAGILEEAGPPGQSNGVRVTVTFAGAASSVNDAR